MENKDIELDEKETIGQVVTLLDENSQPVHFDHLLTFNHINETYIALLPIDEVENVEDDEVIILRVVSGEDGDDRYVPVENDILLGELFNVFVELFDEMMEQEDSMILD